MFKKQTISFEHTNLFNKLVLDYFSKNDDVRSLFSFFPDKEGYEQILNTPNLFESINRKPLVDALLRQSNLVSNTSAASLKNIALLENKNCFTVTTGHQLCLFTGPLYFIYKIISTINIAEWLTANFKDKQFVPIYWMASEDHDFEEVNHAFAFGKKIEWQSKQTGAVGNFKTNELNNTIAELEEILGTTENSKQLIALFKKAYLENKTLADATRYLVNELFGDYGLVILDGNDKSLKANFKTIFKKDIFENIPFKKVNESINYFQSKNYSVQVKPREINCFLLGENSRERIEKRSDVFAIVNTEKTFTNAELEELIEKEPEKISPNVVLRPLYQQSILPNVAYIGGPGELAYWLEYKKMFDELAIQFPILHPRQTVLIIDKGIQQKLEKLGIEIIDVFKTEKELTDQFLTSKNLTVDLETEKNKLATVFDELANKTMAIDKTLEASVKAEAQKAQNSMSMIEAKINKALKQRSDTEITQIKNSRTKLFPENIPQERYDNLSMHYSKWGLNFIPEIKKQLQSTELAYVILLES